MGWIGFIKNAAQAIGKQIGKRKQASQARNQANQHQKRVVEQKQIKAKKAKDTEKDNTMKDASKVKEELKEKGGGDYPAEEVKGHDGSKPMTPDTGKNSNGGGDYDPPREPRSSYRGKSKDPGRSL